MNTLVALLLFGLVAASALAASRKRQAGGDSGHSETGQFADMFNELDNGFQAAAAFCSESSTNAKREITQDDIDFAKCVATLMIQKAGTTSRREVVLAYLAGKGLAFLAPCHFGPAPAVSTRSLRPVTRALDNVARRQAPAAASSSSSSESIHKELEEVVSAEGGPQQLEQKVEWVFKAVVAAGQECNFDGVSSQEQQAAKCVFDNVVSQVQDAQDKANVAAVLYGFQSDYPYVCNNGSN